MQLTTYGIWQLSSTSQWVLGSTLHTAWLEQPGLSTILLLFAYCSSRTVLSRAPGHVPEPRVLPSATQSRFQLLLPYKVKPIQQEHGLFTRWLRLLSVLLCNTAAKSCTLPQSSASRTSLLNIPFSGLTLASIAKCGGKLCCFAAARSVCTVGRTAVVYCCGLSKTAATPRDEG